MSAVGRVVLGFVALLGVASTTGCVSSQVHAVAASPDGKTVIAVGAKLRNDGFGWYPAGPRQWYCVRGADGRLTCQSVDDRLTMAR